jgi:hypothetical protein
VLAGVALSVSSATALGAEADVARRAPPAAPPPTRPAIGLLVDAGVPDGANAALVLRPARWLRLHGGGGTNTVSAGFRAGATLLPLGAGPSLSLELGRYRDGDVNGLVRSFVGSERWLTPLFQQVGYTYGNAQLGLDLGRGPVAFYIHGGLSYLRAELHNANAALAARNAGVDENGTRVTLGSDPVVRVVTPSVKLGLVFYLE